MAGEKEKAELVRKVSGLVSRKFGGSYRAAFDHYARKRSSDPVVDKDELIDLLRDADVGNGMTRGFWADGIIREVDADHDGKVAWSEFERVMRR